MLPEVDLSPPRVVSNLGDVCFVFFHEEGTFSYSKNALAILEHYCSKHNYDLLDFNKPNKDYWHSNIKHKLDTGVCWHKVMACIKALKDFKYKKYVWFDNDIIITDIDRKIDQYFTTDMDFSRDDMAHRWGINSGLFFFQDTKWTRDLMSRWWSVPRLQKGHNDQIILSEVIKEIPPEHYKTHDQLIFNAHFVQHKYPESFCLHMMGTQKHIRNWISKYYKEQVYELKET